MRDRVASKERGFWGALRSAVGATWTGAGIVTTGVTVFGAIVRELQWPLSAMVARIVSAFRQAFHPFVELLFAWFPIEMSDPLRDALVIWTALGAITMRTALPLFFSRQHGVLQRDAALIIEAFAGGGWRAYLGAGLCLYAWPIFLGALLFSPIMFRRAGQTYLDFAKTKSQHRERGGYVRDLRVRFAIQALAVVSVIVGVTALNFAGISLTT